MTTIALRTCQRGFLSAAEFTPIAGITDESSRAKDARILPRVVILDPELTRWTPEALWLATGVKALDHALEALWSDSAHPLVDPLALGAIERLTRWLEISRDPARLDAREQCQIAAWMSISGMLNVGVRLSHPLGHQIGAFWGVPHGITSSGDRLWRIRADHVALFELDSRPRT